MSPDTSQTIAARHRGGREPGQPCPPAQSVGHHIRRRHRPASAQQSPRRVSVLSTTDSARVLNLRDVVHVLGPSQASNLAPFPRAEAHAILAPRDDAALTIPAQRRDASPPDNRVVDIKEGRTRGTRPSPTARAFAASAAARDPDLEVQWADRLSPYRWRAELPMSSPGVGHTGTPAASSYAGRDSAHAGANLADLLGRRRERSDVPAIVTTDRTRRGRNSNALCARCPVV